MPSFLPSEIGRLIYGYLQRECNEDIANEFLNACDSMNECRRQKQRGREFPCKVQNLSLTDILNRYSVLSSLIFDHTCANEFNHHNILNTLQNLLKSKLGSLTNFYHNTSCGDGLLPRTCTKTNQSLFNTPMKKDVAIQHETQVLNKQNESCPRVYDASTLTDVNENLYTSNETAGVRNISSTNYSVKGNLHPTTKQNHATVGDLEQTGLTPDKEARFRDILGIMKNVPEIQASPHSHQRSVSSISDKTKSDKLTARRSSQVDERAAICTPDFKLKMNANEGTSSSCTENERAVNHTPDFSLKRLTTDLATLANSLTKMSSTKLSHVSPPKSTRKDLQAKYQSSNRKLAEVLETCTSAYDTPDSSESNQSRENTVELNSALINSTEEDAQPSCHTVPYHAPQKYNESTYFPNDSVPEELQTFKIPNKVPSISSSNQSEVSLSSRSEDDRTTTRIPDRPVRSPITKICPSSCTEGRKSKSTTPNGKTKNDGRLENVLSRRSWSISPAGKTKNALNEYICSPLRVGRTPPDSKVRRSQPGEVPKMSSPTSKLNCTSPGNRSSPDVGGRMKTRTPVKSLQNSPVIVKTHLHEKTKPTMPGENTPESQCQYGKIKPIILRKTTSCSLPVTRLKSQTESATNMDHSQNDVKQCNPIKIAPKASPRANKTRSAAPAEETQKNLKLLPDNLASKSIPWDYNLRQAIAEESKQREEEEAAKKEISRKTLRKRKGDDVFDEKAVNKRSKIEEKGAVICKKRRKMEELAKAHKQAAANKDRKKEHKIDDAKSRTSRKSDVKHTPGPDTNVKKRLEVMSNQTQSNESHHKSIVVEQPEKIASPSPPKILPQNDLPNKVTVDDEEEEEEEEEMSLNLKWTEEMIFYHKDGIVTNSHYGADS